MPFSIGSPTAYGGGASSSLDALQAAGEHRRQRQVRVHVGAGRAVLEARHLLGHRAVDDPQCDGVVVGPPRRVLRRPRQTVHAPVRVDPRPERQVQVGHRLHHPGREVAGQLRHVTRLGIPARVDAVAPQADVVVRAVVRVGAVHVQRRHERRHEAVLVGQRAQVALRAERVVGGLQWVLVSARELEHAVPVLGVERLDRDARVEAPGHELLGELLERRVLREAVEVPAAAERSSAR